MQNYIYEPHYMIVKNDTVKVSYSSPLNREPMDITT